MIPASHQTAIYLKLSESMKLAIWASLVDRPETISEKRWDQILGGCCPLIGELELGSILDALHPRGIDVILHELPDVENAV